MDSLKILLTLYSGSIVVNLIIAYAQYRSDRNRAQRTIFLFWLFTLTSFFFTGLLPETTMFAITVTTFGIVLANHFLISFFAELHDLKTQWRLLIFTYLASLALSYGLSLTGISYSLYAFPVFAACSFIMLYDLIYVLRNKIRPLTTIQKIFFVNCSILALHILDWTFFKPHVELMTLGMYIAFILMHTLSIVTPFMGNENLLRRRNDMLSSEVTTKVQQISNIEHKLWENNKLISLGRVAGGVAHEVNSPLQVILFHAENLVYKTANRGEISASEAQQAGTKILQMIERISKLTKNLRTVARDRRTVDVQQNDLRKIISDSLSFYLNKLDLSGVHFISELPDHPLDITCNFIEISQVILILINNAMDAVESLEKKQIKLTVKISNNRYLISVEDSGIIDPQIISQLMEPFFTTKPVGKGTGLGLSIAKTIAENHHGQLYLDPTSPNTRFVLDLPLKLV